MFSTEPVTRKARKRHVCTWCAQHIEPGETYETWVSIEDSVFRNKMHPECVSACDEDWEAQRGDGYLPYENERPTKLLGGVN